MPATILPTGQHTFYVPCPSCKQSVYVSAEIFARLTVVDGKGGELRVGCRATPVTHDCRQLIVDVPLPGMSDEEKNSDDDATNDDDR